MTKLPILKILELELERELAYPELSFDFLKLELQLEQLILRRYIQYLVDELQKDKTLVSVLEYLAKRCNENTQELYYKLSETDKAILKIQTRIRLEEICKKIKLFELKEN